MTTLHTQKNPGKLISDNAGYQIWCSSYKVAALPDAYSVELYSVFKHAKSPDEQRTILAAVFTKAELEAFQAALVVPHASA